MAQNARKPTKSRVTPSRVTKSPVAAAPTTKRRDRRKIMVQVMAFILLIALLLPIVAAFL